ncbi:transposon Tf2-1 polyprotein isoform X1 [Cucumis melo var. makuwa]|uniref:Transposon Tf2-1 polyprotein isoform X1 n=1 Tax=Cucumis melo var. makuwa TaxID=1194695 RepID=A0A5D3E2W3_CUCMM|nr:transposon Tf2-1 polyprotein isoform X1 [Cucumis melo var. makuwa]TYK29910.1 transposon Tf2-1 polyprotein isoform X1 [Cucumis melo var. makuwa]
MNAQMKKHQTQQQVILKYIQGIIREKVVESTDLEGSPSKGIGSNVTAEVLIGESRGEGRSGEDKAFDRSKFKKVEMSIFNGIDPDSWLFRADRYFKIHNLTNQRRCQWLLLALMDRPSTGIDLWMNGNLSRAVMI